MERLKSITIIFLLAVGLPASAAPAKSASVLLQEGLYAEEIEGDLDAAIKIYERVIAEAKETRRAAAQATYRIGICYLKKGDTTKAVTQFNNLVSKFPDQKSMVEKARKQLTKLRPATKVFEPKVLGEQIRSGKVPSFEVQLHDNTALDLDSGEISLLKDEWPDRFDVAWDNDGGGVLMKKAGSVVRFLALPRGEKQRWDDAIYMARSDIDELRNSNTRGIWASQGKFAAVLTSEGNLAVIQIGEYDAEQGTIYGWVEKIPARVRGFGPVMERVINDDGEQKHWLIDFDTGRLFSHSTKIRSEEAFLRWIAENRIDAMGETRKSSPGLYGFDMAVIPIAAETWETISPKGLANELSIAKGGIPAVMSAMGKLPVMYKFKTREGGMGVVQILEMQHNKKPRHFRIRYKMLQERAKTVAVGWCKVFLPECDTTVYDLLDLASSRIINSEPGGEVLDLSKPDGKGNLYFDKAKGQLWLVGVRGTRMRLRSGGELLSSKPDFIARGRNAYYLLGEIPCQYLVTTAQGDKYELKVLSVETGDRPGVHIEYWKSAESPGTFAVAMPVRGLSVSLHRKLLDERTLIAINRQDQFGAKWFKVEHEYEVASQSKKQQMIEIWMADAQKPDVKIRSSAIASLGNIVCKQATNLLLKIAQEPLEFSRSNRPRWIAVRGLGRIGDMRAVPVLIDLLDHYNKDTQLYSRVALAEITGLYFGADKAKWRKWWGENGKKLAELDLGSPQSTVISFTKAAIAGHVELALACFAPDSYDYEDVKELLTGAETNPLRMMLDAVDPDARIIIVSMEMSEEGTRCSIKWRMFLKRGFTIEGKTFKAGETFDLDGNLKKVGDRWLIVGI